MDINRRQLLGGAFSAALLPNSSFAGVDGGILGRLYHEGTNRPYHPSKPSLVALFMTAQTMYASCGELFLYVDAEVEEIRGGSRNIDKIMIMPPRSAQIDQGDDRNIGSARASGFNVLSSDLNTVLDVSRQIAGRDVFAVENGMITGHSQHAFFYQASQGLGFEFDPAENPFENDLYQGIRQNM